MSDDQSQDAVRAAADDADDDAAFDPRIQQAVTGMLREWSTSLQTPPLESPPAVVWERIEAAVSQAGLAAAAASGEGNSASHSSHSSTRRLRTLPGGRWTTPLVAASVVGLALVVGANVLGGGSDPADEPALVAADAETSLAGAAVEASVAEGPQVLQAGFIPPARKVMELSDRLTSANVAQTVDEVLDSVGVKEPEDVLDMPTEDWQPGAAGMTSDPQVLRNCVTKVTKVPTSQALLVLRANVNGVDAGLIVVPEFMVDMTAMDGMDKESMRQMGRSMGLTTIYVVEPTCGMEAPDQDPTLLRFSFTLAP